MCSIIGFKKNDEIIVGRNFDFIQNGGKIHFIPRNRSYGVNTYGICILEQMGEDMPYEGINEHGLFVGMAAVVNSRGSKTDLFYMNDLGLIKFILERAKTTEEALTILKTFKINYMEDEYYPKIHYFIVDKTGELGIYEADEFEEISNLDICGWKSITNYSLNKPIECDRMDIIKSEFQSKKILDDDFTIKLLGKLKMDNSVWSTIYNISNNTMQLFIEKDIQHSFTFNINDEINKGVCTIDIGKLKLRNSYLFGE